MKKIKLNNLGELFTEFKKYRAKKSNVAKKENFNKYVGSSLGLFQQKVVGDKIEEQSLWLTRLDGNKEVIEKELILKLPRIFLFIKARSLQGIEWRSKIIIKILAKVSISR